MSTLTTLSLIHATIRNHTSPVPPVAYVFGFENRRVDKVQHRFQRLRLTSPCDTGYLHMWRTAFEVDGRKLLQTLRQFDEEISLEDLWGD